MRYTETACQLAEYPLIRTISHDLELKAAPLQQGECTDELAEPLAFHQAGDGQTPDRPSASCPRPPRMKEFEIDAIGNDAVGQSRTGALGQPPQALTYGNYPVSA